MYIVVQVFVLLIVISCYSISHEKIIFITVIKHITLIDKNVNFKKITNKSLLLLLLGRVTTVLGNCCGHRSAVVSKRLG